MAEDSPADQVIVQRAIADGRVECDLIVVENGEEALKVLRHDAPYDDRERYPNPDLMLLDINMPVLNGIETLTAIRNDPALKVLPVIVLTTSDRQRDIVDSYRLGVNAYLVKPVQIDNFIQAVVQLEKFWFELVILPSIENNN